ncbi:MAG: EVE domain-containing protein [Bacteroidetes bacterium]|nr:EVE domain-containing protein [Bacteroidota bacterium]MBK8487150.1 EVE domain-containing protein [Bacteroidota bacterium]
MQYWLIKSDPETYDWNDIVKQKTDVWDGVRNYAARLHLRAMKKNDLVLFYHSGGDRCIKGIVRIAKEAYPDPTAKEGDWTAVDIKYVKPLQQDVSLAEIKAEPSLADILLIKISRLSVMPITTFQFQKILEMGKTGM